MKWVPGRRALVALAVLLVARGAAAADVELAPFAGVQFPGYLVATDGGRAFTIGNGLDYGGTLDWPVADGWRVELLYSRQSTDLFRLDTRYDLVIERYMAGIEQEQGDEKLRFFGVFLMGATRYGVHGLGSEAAFTLGLSLGLKRALSPRIAFRTEARGFYLVSSAAVGAFCSGGCLFTFGSSGLWQADLSAGFSIGF
jgi:hypothetical protein